jgi:hypothetical protein
MFTCTNDSYCPTADTFESVEDFQAMCEAVFGRRVVLTPRNGGDEWLDESGAVVLQRVNLAVLE